ncbi:translation initiation factor IF-2 [Actinomadura sp. BRA 177]|uniref:translation initiation factor IF-2 n=1 Tax=Actinomadura sp. BRA 177 TaxID=2745202 RepID=UPI0015961359|nr:translation initiation factor IF-2 [Actinomadura sp. BRA 177]NVI86679.1 translation initiation factor IF-2 [Actinomadura sp. BRA 177]
MRRLAIPLLPVLPAVLLAAGCGQVPYSPKSGSTEDPATANARKAADGAGDKLYTARVWPARDLARRATDLDGVEVLRVRGTSTAGAGVVLVVRVSGTGPEPGPFPGATVTVQRCFQMRFSTRTEWHDYETRLVKCPPGKPMDFGPWPKTPDIPEKKLQKVLPRVPAGGRADEAKVRASVASLRLDPAISREFMTEGDVVGLVLKVRPYLSDAFDCVLARVAPERTSVWSPPRIQRMLGEGGCSAGNAIDPMPPPH